MKKIIILLILLTTSDLLCSDYKEEWEINFDSYKKDFFAVDAYDSLNIVAVSLSSIIGAPRLFRTTDGGNNWEQILPDSVLYVDPKKKIGIIYPRSISYPTLNTIIVGSDSGRYCRTTNAGINWQLLQTKTYNEYIKKIVMINDKSGYFITSYNLFFTDDSALTWNEVVLPPIVSVKFICELVAFNENNFKVGMLDENKGAIILNTSDKGINWKISDNGLKATFRLSFVDTLNGWMQLFAPDHSTADEEYDAILNTTNGGTSWEYQLRKRNYPPFGLRWIHFYNQMNGVAGGPKGKVLLTNDGGKNWRRSFLFENDTTTESRCGIMTGPSTSFIFTTEGLVYKLKPDANPVEEAFIQESEFSFFPNPIKAGSKLKVKNFIINGDAYNIKLYNTIGNVVYENKINLSEMNEGIQIPNDISSGLYFLTISRNNFIKTGKIIVND